MKTVKLTSSNKKIDLIIQVAKEMGIKAEVDFGLTDENLGLPGPKVSEEQLDYILSKGNGEGGYTSAQMKERIKKRAVKSKAGKNGSTL